MTQSWSSVPDPTQLNLLDVCLTVDVAVDTGGVGGDVQVGPQQEEHPGCEGWSLVDDCDGDTTVVRLTDWVSVVDLQDNVVVLLQLEPDIARQFGWLSVFCPGKHDLRAVCAHGVVGAVPGRTEALLDGALTAADDHVVSPVAPGDGLELRGPDVARCQVLDRHSGAQIVVSLAWSDS